MTNPPAPDRPEHPSALGGPLILCPYCGSVGTQAKQCSICTGYFDLLSRQRSQNAMGPWFVRDLARPFQPGCSYATLVRMVQRGKIKPDTALRGPSTRQFWSLARHTPGVAHLLGECHACHTPVMPTSTSCSKCRASFLVADDRQHLGLGPVHLLPGDADAATIARALGAQTPAAPVVVPESVRASVVDTAPVPEPQVVVEEPEWIEEPEPERTNRWVPAAVGLIIVALMVGAGVWAWLHLSAREEGASIRAAGSMDEAPGEVASSGNVDGVDEDEPDLGVLMPGEVAVPTPDAEVPEESAEISESDAAADVPAVSGEGRTAEVDAARVAFDRALARIASGEMDAAGLEEAVREVGAARAERLREAWAVRASQLRLGRRGE